MTLSQLRPKTLAGILNFYLGIGLVVITLALSVSGYYFISHILQESLKSKALALAEQVSTLTLDAVMLQEYSIIERMSHDLVNKNPDLLKIKITNQHNQVLSEVTQTEKTDYPGLEINKPLTFFNRPAGNISLHFSTTSINQSLLQLSILAALAFLFMLASLFFAVQQLLSKHVINPIQDLCLELNSTQKIFYETLDLKQDLPDELSLLNNAVYKLQQALQQHIKSLATAHEFSAKATQNLCQSQKLITTGQMAAGLAHNLNTPLANIIGYSQMAIQQTEDNALIERLQIIERQAKNCSDAVKNLLDSAKKPDLIIQSIDLVSFIDNLLQTMTPIARQKSNMRLQFNHPTSALSKIDPSSFEQIVFNLISNSMEANATEMIFTLMANKKTPGWKLQVEDNGEGIDKETQEKVFKAFFSTKTANEQSNSGTGLGLYLNRTLLQQMHGEITIQKSDQNGTTFLLQVPIDA